MKHKKLAAVLIPIRSRKDSLEVLLTRRSFWNKEKNRIMSYPGEWVFAGGHYEPSDDSLKSTAIREFREEVGYKGLVKNVTSLYDPLPIQHRKEDYCLSFYLAQIDQTAELRTTSEVSDLRWDTPQNWLSYLNSSRFAQEQKIALARYSINHREVASQTLATLRFLENNKNTIYGGTLQ